MGILFERNAYNFGFWTAVIISIMANAVSLFVSRSAYMNRIQFAHDGYSWGFPFKMFLTYSGYPYSYHGFIQFGLIANVFIAVIFSVFLGFFVNLIWSKYKVNRYE